MTFVLPQNHISNGITSPHLICCHVGTLTGVAAYAVGVTSEDI